MKRNKLAYIFLLTVSILVTACETDEDPVEDSDVRDRFVGRWNCTEVSQINGERTFFVDIDYDTTSTDKIELINFYDMGTSSFVLGEISTTNEESINIPVQDLDGLSAQGSGIMENNDLLLLNYLIDDGLELDSVNATFIRQ